MKKTISFAMALLIVVSMVYAVPVFAAAESSSGFISNETGTEDVSQNYDMNYSLSQEGETEYVDALQAYIEWEITNIDVSVKEVRTWILSLSNWKTTKEVQSISDGSAVFTIYNKSSLDINASVSFAAESEFSAPTVTYKDNVSSVMIPDVLDEQRVNAYATQSKKIRATVTPVEDDFKTKSYGEKKYGTFTITISAVVN